MLGLFNLASGIVSHLFLHFLCSIEECDALRGRVSAVAKVLLQAEVIPREVAEELRQLLGVQGEFNKLAARIVLVED